MNEVATAEEIKKLTAPILEKGFSFEYFYEKGGDSSCVYICRFRKVIYNRRLKIAVAAKFNLS